MNYIYLTEIFESICQVRVRIIFHKSVYMPWAPDIYSISTGSEHVSKNEMI